MASIEKQQLLTFNFGVKTDSVDKREDGNVVIAGVDAGISSETTFETTSAQVEKTIGQKLGTALAVLSGTNPTSVQSSSLSSNTIEQNGKVERIIPEEGKNSNPTTEISKNTKMNAQTSISESSTQKKYSKSQGGIFLEIEKTNLRRINLTCDAGCENLTVENANKLSWAIENQDWILVEQTILKMNTSSDSGYYWLGVSAVEQGFSELAKIYFQQALDLSSRPSKNCEKGSSMPCFGVNVNESAKKNLEKLELSLSDD